MQRLWYILMMQSRYNMSTGIVVIMLHPIKIRTSEIIPMSKVIWIICMLYFVENNWTLNGCTFRVQLTTGHKRCLEFFTFSVVVPNSHDMLTCWEKKNLYPGSNITMIFPCRTSNFACDTIYKYTTSSYLFGENILQIISVCQQ